MRSRPHMLMRIQWIFAVLAGVALAQAPDTSQVPRTLGLKQAEAIAIANHPRVSAARFEAQAAGQVPAEVRSALFPTVYGSFTGAGAQKDTRIAAGALNNPTILSRLASGLTASQLLLDFGRTNNLVASSRASAAAMQSTEQATEADVLLEVNRAYFGALRAQGVLTVARQTVEARRLVDDQVRALARSKLKSSLDVSFADVNLSSAKLLLVSAQNDLEAAFAELSTAMGYVQPQHLELIDEPLPPAPPADSKTVLDTAIRKRPELEALRANRDAALKTFAAEKNLWLPTISAVTSFGFVPNHGESLPPHYAAAGLNINVPILNGHLFAARREEANLKAQAAEQRLRAQSLSVAREVTLAWLEAQTAFQRMSLTAQLLDDSRQALELAQARYDIGLSSIVELSQAQLAETSAEIANVTARYDYQIRYATVQYQMGELH